MSMLLVSVAVALAVLPGAATAAIRIPVVDIERVEIGLGSSCVDERGSVRPAGDLVVVPGSSPAVGEGRVVTYIVEVERGLPVDAACFARVVEYTLHHPLGWTADGSFTFRRIDEGPPDIRVTLASPPTVDRQCLPLRTGGIYSCWNGARAMINYTRWTDGADDFGEDLEGYRTYVINHEVGHGLGHGHRGCPQAETPAPVMMQQTKTVGGCSINGWPAWAELRSAAH